ncbi:unnamed protein product [Rotaria magnacalcarata]|uniref:Uncharacterized protein n=3 Tax=Rotaria magnacalcarata TaxID=392030 RepID=A0A814WPY2_9BILA|nr:unnamed protein product [Rotaria magnacalcarata]CAF1921970.1 unnamed protein product [Rotaria magnacalcarata]
MSKLVNRVETHQDKVEQQFKNLSKKINQTTVDSSLEMYRRDGETFSRTVVHNGQNLLNIYDAGDHGRYARKVMQILFTLVEMSESILYANSPYSKPGLDPNRMQKFKVFGKDFKDLDQKKIIDGIQVSLEYEMRCKAGIWIHEKSGVRRNTLLM